MNAIPQFSKGNGQLKDHRGSKLSCKSNLAGIFWLLPFLFVMQTSIVSGQTVQTYNTTSTWLCPAGVTSITVECWGGGGAGGGATGNPAAGGGGAGGSYVKNTSISVTPGTTYTVTVGTGGIGSTGAGASGNDSWFNSSGTIMAKGGPGGARANSNSQTAAGAAALTSGNVGFTAPFSYYGGAGGTGVALGVSGGGGGSSAGTGSNGNAGLITIGGSAPTGGGAGVNGSASSADGADNTNLGGGGAGARAGSSTNRNGGNGGDGQVTLTYIQPSCPLSTAVTPSATQSGCTGFSANTLTANITLSGTSGTPTLLYQWYYNTTNSNTVAGATFILGATAATYTPSTSTAGTRYYFCVGYATNNSCAETNATQSLASNTVQVTITASMSGTYTVGPGQTYTTLTAAVAAYNSACLSGPVLFVLTNNNYSGSETFPIIINANAGASSTNTLTIKPNTGVTATISGSLSNNALIKILGNYVTIDGSNNGSTSRDLTITNTSGTNPTVVLIGSTGTTAITNSALKNCFITDGVNTGYAIVISDAATIGSAGYCNNITVQNNSIKKAYFAIMAVTVNTGTNGSGMLIDGNDMSTSGTNAIRNTGIYLQDVYGATLSNNSIGNFEAANNEYDQGIWFASGTRNCSITGNTISNLGYTGSSTYGPNGIYISTNTANSNLTISNNTISGITSAGTVITGGDGAACGIYIIFASAGGTVYGNTISNIKNTNAGGYGCNAIQLGATSTSANFSVYNNMIFDIASLGSTSTRSYERNGHGIVVSAGGGYNIYNNTVLLNTNQTNNGYPSAINITSNVTAASAINLKNNIFVNTQTQAGERYAIQSGAANTVYASIDYNDYYTSGTNLGYVGATNRASLAAVQTGFGSNTNSLNILPVFVSSTDMHIQTTSPLANEPLNNSGTPIGSITTDIDSQLRNILTPDMGADEFKGHGSWVGAVSSDWTNASNWFDNYVPTATTHIEINTASFMPVVSSTTQPAKNIVIESPGTLTVNGTGVLQIAGSMMSTGTFDASAGTIEMNGIVSQTIPSGIFFNNNVNNLIISNTDAATGVTLAGNLDIYRSLTFGAAGLKLTTGGFLTFKSTATQTAWLGNMTGKTISGAATVERYIPNHAKAWQFLAVPTKGQTVNAAWQEGNAPLVIGTAGLGTILTSNVAGAGFDIVAGNSASIKSFDSTTRTWVGIANTNVLIDNQKGYMVFVRGDRSVQTTSAPATATNLRSKGTLYTPASPPSVVNMAANTIQSVGNPYPSAIDLTQLSRTGGVQDIYYVWDPKLTTSPSVYGLGAYQTLTRSGATYLVTPGGGSYVSGTTKTIESGQAFFVRAPFATGTVTFTEACKTSGSNDVNRVSQVAAKQLRTNLRVLIGNVPVLIDGTLLQYDNAYSNSIDINDAAKLGNTGENFGMMRNNNLLSVERRAPILLSDTIFYNLGQMRVQQYQLEFIPDQLEQPGMQAFLEDNYLHTATPVSLREPTIIKFGVVNIPGSYASNRFRLVFRSQRQPGTVPVANSDSKGTPVDTGNKVTAQDIIKINPAAITVYPNPVIDKVLKIKFQSQPLAVYDIQLMNNLGEQVYSGSIQLTNSDMIKSVKLAESIPPGIYQLSVVSTVGVKNIQQVIIK